jgi:hypothetical protein
MNLINSIKTHLRKFSMLCVSLIRPQRKIKSEFRKTTLIMLDTLLTLPKDKRREYLTQTENIMKEILGSLGHDFITRKRFFKGLQNFLY